MSEYIPISPNLFYPLAGFAVLIILLLAFGKVPLSYNLRNLTVRWKTTVVTALAFTLVVGLLTVMMAFVTGMDRLTEGSGIPGNVITLSDGATDEAQSNLSAEYSVKVLPQDIKKEIVLDSQGRPLSSREIYAVVNQPIKNAAPGGRQRRFLQIRGLEDPDIAAQVHKIELYPGGKWFPGHGFQQRPRTVDGKPVAPQPAFTASAVGMAASPWGTGPFGTAAALIAERNATVETLYEVVIGEGVARDLGTDENKSSLEVGDVFAISSVQAVVVGVMKSDGTTFASEIWAQSGWVGERFNKGNNFSSIASRTRNAETARKVSEMVKQHKEGAATAMPETEYYSKLTATNNQFRIAVFFIAIIMAVGGMLGVMNTMFAAISQRTKDIGVLRILGYGRRQILVSFLLESLTIALVGGLMGCALGGLFNGVSASSTLSSGPGGGGKSVMLRLVVDADTLASGLLFTLVMGALGGLVPSLSAMRLRPLESLR
jgi:ABC-type lipoprotein release transport system permease subunit